MTYLSVALRGSLSRKGLNELRCAQDDEMIKNCTFSRFFAPTKFGSKDSAWSGKKNGALLCKQLRNHIGSCVKPF